MDRTERFYKIDQLLKDGKVVPFAGLKDALGVSRATLKRDLVYLRDRLHARERIVGSRRIRRGI